MIHHKSMKRVRIIHLEISKSVVELVRKRRLEKYIGCPHCGKPMKKRLKKSEYECGNPKCPVIFVRIHDNRRHVGLDARCRI